MVCVVSVAVSFTATPGVAKRCAYCSRTSSAIVPLCQNACDLPERSLRTTPHRPWISNALARASPAVVVGICFAVAALEGYDIQAFGVAAPKIVAELSLDAGQMGWAASVAMLGLVIGAPINDGVMARRKSAKPTSPTNAPVRRSRTTQYPKPISPHCPA